MTHRERNRLWSTSHGRRLVRRRTYGACVDAGLCVTCQAAPAAPDRVRCADCAAYHREAKRKARDAGSSARGATISVLPGKAAQIRQGSNGEAVAGGRTAATCNSVVGDQC